MSFSLVNNLSALSSQSKLAATGAKLNLTIQRLSSGLRINSSGDDAAGLAVANHFRSDIAILNQGVRNANDGLSTLQIVDSGLNTISNLLDRAAALSTQSASGTFVGNRNILNSELSDVLGEVTRQAEVVGLVNGGANNRLISTVIGGGSDTFAAPGSNNSVDVDLSGAGNRVDATSLGLNNLNIGTGSGNVTGAQDISGGLAAAETLTFQNVGASGQLTSYTVTLSAGASASNVIDTINHDANVQAAGITASLNSSNQLVLTSANFFTVSSDTANVANQTGLVTNANDVKVTGAANYVTKTISAGTAGDTQTLSFTGSEIGFADTSHNVSFGTFGAVSYANAQTIADSVNNDTTLRQAGVFAIVTDAGGAQVQFVSLHNFNLAISSSAGSVNATNNIDALQSPTAASSGTLAGGIDGAKQALDAIRTAIDTLGRVQGRVGAGQNRLLQAIDLATAQINNFQAAESRIRDADISAEAANLSRLSVLQQAGVAALAQANQSSQAVLSLLR
jgi:flagellin